MGGKDWDIEESLIYMAARYYDPRFGRFTSRDPEQTTMSPYSYCSNNPISLVDPTGHRSGCASGGYSYGFPRQDYWVLMAMKLTPVTLMPRNPAPELRIYADASVSLAGFIADLLFNTKVQAIQERNMEMARLRARFEKISKAMENPDAAFPKGDNALALALAKEVKLWLREEHPEFADLEDALGEIGLFVKFTAKYGGLIPGSKLDKMITSNHPLGKRGTLTINIQTNVEATMGDFMKELATGIVHEVSEAYVSTVKNAGWALEGKAHYTAEGYCGVYGDKGFFNAQNIGMPLNWSEPMLSLRNNVGYYYNLGWNKYTKHITYP